jgi:TonB family protein
VSAETRAPLGTSFGAAATLHVAFVAAILVFARESNNAMPPVYRVNIIAAPPGPRAIGVVQPPPPPTAPPIEPTPPPPAVERPPVTPTFAPKKVPVPTRVPQKATPTTTPPPPTTKPVPAPRAGGGPAGGTGADVATVQLDEGITFPYPEYLDNIVRQVALNFKPDDPNTALRAVVSFLILRNGTVTGIQLRTRSGDYAFDLEAHGAIEKAAKSFGKLPDGFKDDALPVYFSFDPRILH